MQREGDYKYKRWSITAVFCYKRGCVCENCPVQKELETKCKMKSSVIELVRVLGIPKESEFKNE